MASFQALTQGRVKCSKQSQGGASVFYIFNYIENVFTYANGIVTAINPLLTIGNVFKYELIGDGNKVDESLVSDRTSGTTVNTQTSTFNLKAIDAATSAEMNKIAYDIPILVVPDRNGIYHAIGIDDGVDFTVAQFMGDTKIGLNGYTLTGISTTGSLSPKLDAATISAFLALVA